MTDNYATPSWLMDCFDGWFDPCPLNPNPSINGLEIEWRNKTYCNPPYSEPLKWVTKAIKESKKGKLVVLLLRADTSTEWFRKLVEAKAEFLYFGLVEAKPEFLYFGRRIKFNGKIPYFASMLVILNGESK